MRKIIATLAAIGVVAAPASAGVNSRQHDQWHRIGQGVRSGELTRGETRRLGRQQVRIARAESRMRASGGGLSTSERERLELRQDRAGAEIYTAKHNGRTR